MENSNYPNCVSTPRYQGGTSLCAASTRDLTSFITALPCETRAIFSLIGRAGGALGRGWEGCILFLFFPRAHLTLASHLQLPPLAGKTLKFTPVFWLPLHNPRSTAKTLISFVKIIMHVCHSHLPVIWLEITFTGRLVSQTVRNIIQCSEKIA